MEVSSQKTNSGNIFLKFEKHFCETAIVIIIILIYNYSSYYSNFLEPLTKTILSVISFIYICYIWCASIFLNSDIRFRFCLLLNILIASYQKYFSVNKSTLLKKDIITKENINPFLFIIVKLFYIPIMLNFVIINATKLQVLFFVSNNEINQKYVNFNWYNITASTIFLVDTLYFLFGYLFESNKLNNKLRSVDKSAISWIFTLACYPPFNGITTEIFPWAANEKNLMVLDVPKMILLSMVLFLFTIYLSATIALGTKCSNLTNRGIVNNGPYKYMRHPAYSSKILAWWLMCLPVMNIYVFVNMFFWSIVYLIRALKEEDHLLNDKEYIEYYHNTPNRFFPHLKKGEYNETK